MLQSVSSVFVVYRRKTLTGSPDPMHANGMDKPCMSPMGHALPHGDSGRVYQALGDLGGEPIADCNFASHCLTLSW